ncbi:MAG: peptide chain release factor-like protein [Pirellulaceae bacterium]
MMNHPSQIAESELLKGCDEQRTRGSGPGGQHRNKVETAIVITHRETGVTGAGSESREQKRNRENAIFRLRMNLALAVRTPVDSGEPQKLWEKYITGGRIRINENNPDLPALLADALNRLEEAKGDLAPVAIALRVTNSQLARWLKSVSAAWVLVNRWREQNNLPRLK